MFHQTVQKIFSAVFPEEVIIKSITHLGGGSINEAVLAETTKGCFFLKWNILSDMFEKEATGLKLLASTNTVSIPKIISSGGFENTSYLILEYFGGAPKSLNFWSILGRQLANLHKNSASYYGLEESNYIGSLPQENHISQNWIEFFIHHRLDFQVKMAFDGGMLDDKHVKLFQKLYLKLSDLLILESPSLVHGDLWSGNLITDNQGNPALIDPAVYYGNREVDLAMTTLFGGFHDDFYEAYLEAFPLEKGYKERWEIYNLYPLLVHLNLFGYSYLNAITSVLRKYN